MGVVDDGGVDPEWWSLSEYMFYTTFNIQKHE